MGIKITDIPPEGLTIEINESVDLLETGSATTPYKAALAIMPTGGGAFRISGRVRADVVLECSRCLTRFDHAVDTEVGFDLEPVSAIGPEPEHELGSAELDTEFYGGDELDPAELIREQIVLALPMVPVHREDCKGLCPSCGTDLNRATCGCRTEHWEEGAFSALKNLFKK